MVCCGQGTIKDLKQSGLACVSVRLSQRQQEMEIPEGMVLTLAFLVAFCTSRMHGAREWMGLAMERYQKGQEQ